ncbi:MAG: hypothetical protein ABSF22_21680, partial [Bryobacteraceae bacterium]
EFGAVSVVAVIGQVVSNTLSLPIMAGGGVCSDPLTGETGTLLNTLGGLSTYTNGSVLLLQTTTAQGTQAAAIADFETEQGSVSTNGFASLGSCVVTTAVVSTGTPTFKGVDAGTISVSGSTGSETLGETLIGEYAVQLPNGFIPATGGSFTFTGSGGATVGPFTVSVSYSNPLSWTNSTSISSITRTSGQNITWTGGASGSYVYIGGSSQSSTASANFVCYAPVSAGQFTIPSYVLLALPAGSGTLGVENIATPVSFTATGLNNGVAITGVGFSINPTYN